MNIKDYTLKIGYRLDGKYQEESIDSCDIKNGYSDEIFDVRDEGGEDAVKIVVNAKKAVKAELAELIYDHYYEQTERFLPTVFNRGRLRASTSATTYNTDCARFPNSRL